tara:strand:+ start:549 stop:1511 length:963 start_codon:yes stop_codon:yes gene_type:complete
MKYHIHLHSEPHGVLDPSGTCRVIDYPESQGTLTWDICDNPVAETFIAVTKSIQDQPFGTTKSPRNFIDWNRYGKHISWSSWETDAELLNAEMEHCTSHGYVQFDKTFRIQAQLTEEERASRLNRIHFAFEKELENKDSQSTGTPEFFASLERLNKLVHSLEKAPNSKFGESFYVVRHSSDHIKADFPELTDAHYRCFENNTENGDLYLDFFTVGKDLGHAFHTNDTELIKAGEVKQQSVISGSVAFAMDRAQFGLKNNNQEQARYWQWCKDANAELYGYDYTEPRYNLGRAPIGRASQTYSQMENILNATPYVVGVSIE